MAHEPRRISRIPGDFGMLGALVALGCASGLVSLPWAGGAYDARYAAVAVVAAGWLLLFASGREARLRFDRRLVLATVLAAAVVLASTLASRYPLDALFSEATNEAGAILWLANLGVFLFAASAPLDRRVRGGLVVVVPVIAAMAFWGFGQALLGQVVSVLVNADYFSATLVVYLPVAFALAATAKTRGRRIAWLACAALVAMGIGAAATSSGLAGMVLVLLGLGAWAPRAFGLHHKVPGARRLAAVLGAGLVVVQVPWVMERLLSLKPLEAVLGATAVTRLDFWNAAWRGFLERPVLGWGVDGYARVAQRFIPAKHFALESSFVPQYMLPADAHSLVWTMLAMFGVAGVVAFGWVACVWLRSSGVSWSAEPIAAPETGVASELDDADFLRRCLAIAVLGYVATLLFVPLSLVGGATLSLFAGLAIARPRSGSAPDVPGADAKPDTATRAAVARPVAVAAVLLAIALLVLGAVRVYDSGLLASVADAKSPAARDAALDRILTLEPYRAEIRFLRLLNDFSAASVSGDVTSFHDAVDSERPAVREYAPYLSFLVMASLTDAERTGRADLSWERENLARAVELAPGLPMPKASALHLAILERDKAAAAAALSDITRSQVPGQFWKGLLQPKVGPPSPSL